jgi:hypothetical protein
VPELCRIAEHAAMVCAEQLRRKWVALLWFKEHAEHVLCCATWRYSNPAVSSSC